MVDAHISREILDLGRPPSCSSPENAGEVAMVLREACQAGHAVVPWGGGTDQGLGSPPSRCDTVLETRKLAGIVAYAPEDLTVSVLAGTTLGEVREVLAARGQFLPYDVAHPDQATIGGVLAANTASVRRFRYGAARDLVIGITTALPSGELCKAGGRVVKNVAGYDLCKLWVGSLGTLGIITSANFRVQPICKVAALITGRFPTWEAAVRAGLWSAGQGHVWSALFVRGGPTPTLLVIVEGFDGSVRAATGAATEAADREGGECRIDSDATAVEAALRDLAQHYGSGAGQAGALIKVSTAPGLLIQAINMLMAVAASSDVSVDWQADVGVGSLFATLSGPEAHLVAAIPRARTELVALGGSLVVCGGSPALRRALDPWGAPETAAPLARALKARMDPSGTLNPGRYCYGL